MKTSETVTMNPEQIFHELRTLIDEAEKALGKEPAQDQEEGAIARLRERCESAQARLTELYNDAKQKVAHGAKATDHLIRTNPYQSLAVALAVGLAAGAIIGRKTKVSAP